MICFILPARGASHIMEKIIEVACSRRQLVNSGAIVPAERREIKRGKNEGGLRRAAGKKFPLPLFVLVFFVLFCFCFVFIFAPFYYLNAWNRLS